MRTFWFVFSGFLMAGACYGLIPRLIPETSLARRLITPGFALFWGGVALVNMLAGVLKAGYRWAEELPLFLIIFAPPLLLLLWLNRR